jgi:hypothetical protein
MEVTMPLRETKLYPSEQNYQRTTPEWQDAWPWVDYIHGLLKGLTDAERASAKVQANINISYQKEVSQAEIDSQRLRIVAEALNGIRPGEGMSAEEVKALRYLLDAV